MKNQQRGLSLIEVMVSLVILVVGLIGIFNLHIIAKRGSFESFQQTQATYLANDIVNRMKLNRSELSSYADTYTGAKTAVKSCETNICTTGETLLWDKYQWDQSLIGAAEQIGEQNVGGLDSPVACITESAGTISVIIAWRGIREMSASSTTEADCGSSLGKRRRVFSLNTMIL
ncbi:type IV pilus modification protein PilV [Shewanella sp. KX20019]|uniref:type IV pilus modification protein PilV n=1 Tax=Shewanella sp. KX20019 TaxID=2803864 RepID=UPI001926E7A4|nr:type IV pilus modification protein PilV [Shewanella sp. KX20019]QQX81505.1 type IV pilus modification protein PilV [Shewanella sp. KX20019]